MKQLINVPLRYFFVHKSGRKSMAKQIRLITDSHKRRLKQIERHANEASASENEDGANGRWRNNLAYFKVTGKLGSGSFGDVFEASYSPGIGKPKRQCAFKLARVTADEYTSLIQELTYMKDLKHENVVPLHCALMKYGFLCFITPKLICIRPLIVAMHKNAIEEEKDRNSNAKNISKQILSTECVRELVYQLVDGMSYLHESKIAHRDLKCGNLLLNSSGVLKITDFGLAKAFIRPQNPVKKLIKPIVDRVRKRKSEDLGVLRTPCGTLGYMAPEVGQLDEYDVRADTWSIGMTILELIFGERPFQQFEYEESAERVIQRVFTQGIELKIKEIYPDNGAKIEKELPEDLRRLICRCLQGDRDLRPKCQFLFTQPFLCNFEPSTRHIQKELLDQDVIVDADIIQKKKETEDCRSLGDHLFYPNGNYILFTFATWHNDKLRMTQINVRVRAGVDDERWLIVQSVSRLLPWVLDRILSTDDFIHVLNETAFLRSTFSNSRFKTNPKYLDQFYYETLVKLERAGDDDKQKRNALDGYLLVCTTNHQYATDKADLFVDSEWDEHQLDTVREMCKVTMDREESPEPEYDDSPLEL